MFVVLESANHSTMLGDVIVASGAFLILLLLIKKYAWGSITSIFEERAKKISDDIDSAEEAQKKANELLSKRQDELSKSRDEADEIIKNATSTANVSKENILSDARKEAEYTKAKANDEIERARKDALSDAKDEVADLSIDLAEKLIKNSLNNNDSQEKLINDYLEKLGE
jgi:ATP synthase, F0 subunit b